QSGPLPDQGWAKLIHSGHFTARIKDVGENHRGTAEHSVFKGDSLVNRNIILDLDTVPYNHSRPQHDILPDPTVLADPRVFQNVRDMPDGGPFTDRDILVHKSGGVNKILFAPVARRGYGSGFILAVEGFLTSSENIQHLDCFFAVSPRFLAGLDAVEEVSTFSFQRFLPFQWDDFSIGLTGHRHLPLPLDGVR